MSFVSGIFFLNLNFFFITEYNFSWIWKKGIYKIAYEDKETGPSELSCSVLRRDVSPLPLSDSPFMVATMASAGFF